MQYAFERRVHERRFEVAMKRADARAAAKERRQRRQCEEKGRVELEDIKPFGLQHLFQIAPQVCTDREMRDRAVAVNFQASADAPRRDPVRMRQRGAIYRRQRADDRDGMTAGNQLRRRVMNVLADSPSRG